MKTSESPEPTSQELIEEAIDALGGNAIAFLEKLEQAVAMETPAIDPTRLRDNDYQDKMLAWFGRDSIVNDLRRAMDRERE